MNKKALLKTALVLFVIVAYIAALLYASATDNLILGLVLLAPLVVPGFFMIGVSIYDYYNKK